MHTDRQTDDTFGDKILAERQFVRFTTVKPTGELLGL